MPIDTKDRLKIPRQKMPEQDPGIRATNFEQVNYGFTLELAQLEANRCIQCKKPLCVQGCPVYIDIPAFIKLIEIGDFIGAARKLKEKNCLPAICGRVCPQEIQCEVACVLSKKSRPVAIGHLERFAADYERAWRGDDTPEAKAQRKESSGSGVWSCRPDSSRGAG